MKNQGIGRWSLATTNIFKAISKLIRAMKVTPDSYLAYIPNEKAGFPIKIPNPKLDDPFNWTMDYGVPQAPDKNQKYFNDTARDLTLNWIASFGSKRSITRYRKHGILDKGLVKGGGICFPIRKTDYMELRQDLGRDFNLWTTHWKPVGGISYWIQNPEIKKVYVIANLEELLVAGLKPSAFARAVTFIMGWTKYIPKKSVLQLSEYRHTTFRWGSGTHSYSIEFQIPKVFRWEA